MVAAGSLTAEIKNTFCHNFVKLTIDKNISQSDMEILQTKLAQLKPNSLVVDYNFDYNKLLTDTTSATYDFSGISIKDAIEEFVNLLDIENKKAILDYTLNLYSKYSTV